MGDLSSLSQLELVDLEIKKRQGPNVSIACAVDGSQMADKAVQAGLALFNNRRGDKFTVLHISNSAKSYLGKHLLPSHLRNYYLDMAHANRVTAEWLCREKDEGRGTNESVTRLADKAGADLLFMGSWGRKGEKLDTLGTVSDYSIRAAHCSIAIVRSASSALNWNRPINYMCATDGSHAAHLAFCFLCNYLLRPNDTVHVTMVTTADGTEENKKMEQYRLYMKNRKVNGQCHVRCIDRLCGTVPEGIVDAVAEYSCDVLVCGISGYGRKKLGSVSEDISARATCTTFIIKDSRELISNRYTTAGMATLASEVA